MNTGRSSPPVTVHQRRSTPVCSTNVVPANTGTPTRRATASMSGTRTVHAAIPCVASTRRPVSDRAATAGSSTTSHSRYAGGSSGSEYDRAPRCARYPLGRGVPKPAGTRGRPVNVTWSMAGMLT